MIVGTNFSDFSAPSNFFPSSPTPRWTRSIGEDDDNDNDDNDNDDNDNEDNDSKDKDNKDNDKEDNENKHNHNEHNNNEDNYNKDNNIGTSGQFRTLAMFSSSNAG